MYTGTIEDLINIMIISIGIGVCGVSILQVRFGADLPKHITKYFEMFFSTILIYIVSHLIRSLLEGNPGGTVGFWIRTVTFLEFTASGVMAFFFSMLALDAAKSDKAAMFRKLFLVAFAGHMAVLVINLFNGLCYIYDSNNVYHRSSGYLISNLFVVILIIMDIYILVKYRKNYEPHIRSACWVYAIAPFIAIALQAFSGSIQFIILAIIVSAAYLSIVIMRDLLNRFHYQERAAARVGAELGMANEIQAGQLPKLFPSALNRPELDVFGYIVPAKEVGGDFYDFFTIDDEHIGFVIGNVSRKGVSATLFMMITRVLIRSRLQNGESPKKALESINDQLCESAEDGLSINVWTAVLNVKTGDAVSVNAGHEHPVVRKAGDVYALISYEHSPALATAEGLEFEENKFTMKPGDSVFLYNDGVITVSNKEKERLGHDRMLEALNRKPGAAPKQVIDNVMNGINLFVEGVEQKDDISMLSIRYNGT